jgi:hypothetical protein
MCRRATAAAPEETMGSSLQADLAALVASPEDADVALRLDDGSLLPAHRVVLASRCEYFRTIFDENFAFTESRQREIPLPGVARSTLEKVLQYVYAAQEEAVLDEGIVEALQCADRLLLDDLRQICEAELERSLDTENSAFLLEIADRHNAPRLKRCALEHVILNWDAFSASPALGQLALSGSHVLRELDYLAHQKNLTARPGEVIRLAQKLARQPAPSPAPPGPAPSLSVGHVSA